MVGGRFHISLCVCILLGQCLEEHSDAWLNIVIFLICIKVYRWKFVQIILGVGLCFLYKLFGVTKLCCYVFQAIYEILAAVCNGEYFGQKLDFSYPPTFLKTLQINMCFFSSQIYSVLKKYELQCEIIIKDNDNINKNVQCSQQGSV